jgi:hypothetical protein
MVMSSAGPSRLTNELWLAAHDSTTGRTWVGARPLAVGLATGLLAELVHDGFLKLQNGTLFRTSETPPDDPALGPLLVKMQAEERSRLPPPSPVRTGVPEGRGHSAPLRDTNAPDWSPSRETLDWPSSVSNAQDRPSSARHLRDWPPPAQGWSSPPHAVPEQTRHSTRGHELSTWMSYLADEQRAEMRVIDRLARAGLVRQEQHRRVFGGITVRYVPYDSVVSGNPANTITSAIVRGRHLPCSQLFLAGLFLATGLHHHALATLTPSERSELAGQLGRHLDEPSRELLRAADTAVGEAAMR